MRNRLHLCRILRHASFICVTMMADLAHADPMVDFVIEQFQEQCDAEQANFLGIDGDLDPPRQGVLSLTDDAIYDIALTADGVTGTVLYNEFHCTNVGYGWCGSGGCGFHIIVDGVAFFRRSGFRPTSVTQGDGTFVLIPIHGSGCVTSDGHSGAGADPCYVVATWDSDAATFRSQGGEIDLSPLNP